MKFLFLFGSIFFSSISIFAAEIIKIKLFDGEIVEGKLDLPANRDKIKELVIFVHGTGPGTYLDKRKFGTTEFNYFDYFSQEFNKRGIGFFVANKRGVEIGDQPPFFDKIDREKFKKVVPNNSAQDLASAIKTLRQDKRLKKAKIILFGWSEGTIIASMVADDKNNKVDGLFLAGYVHENMSDVIRWQNEGESSIISIRGYFDKNADNQISKEEYESTDKTATAMRIQGFKDARFEQIDVNKDNTINNLDFKIIRQAPYKMILDKWQANDEDWIWQNYFRVSINWLNEHAKLEANKTRLFRLKMPIYIFHGEDDANCDVNWVYDLKEHFAKAKKKNLQTFIFKEHDHNLNFMTWVRAKTIPNGIKKIFEVATELAK